MTTTILSALDVAKLTARLEGSAGYKRSASKDAAIARFIKSAAAKAIGPAAASLCLTQAKSLAEAEALVDVAIGAAVAIATDTLRSRKAKAAAATEAENLAATVAGDSRGAGPKRAKRTPQVAALPGMTPLGVAKPDVDMPDFLVRRGSKEETAASEAAWAKAAERRRARQDAEDAAKPKPASKNMPALSPAAAKAVQAIAGEGRVRKSTAEMAAAAAAGTLPPAPDFSADTHKRFRPKLAELVALAEAGDVKGLKAYPINPISTSPKAMDRYRNLCVIALEAQAAAAGKASKKAA